MSGAGSQAFENGPDLRLLLRPRARPPHDILRLMADDIRVALVDDDAAFRSSLRLLVNGSPGFSCCGDWPTVEAAVDSPKLGLADVLLLDLHLPGMDGDEGVGRVLDRHPRLTVLMFTGDRDDQRVFRSLCFGACGYLLKSTTPVRLLEAVSEAHDGGSPMSPVIARKVVGLFRQTAPPPTENHSLTPREIELLAMLADGHSYQSAAGGLGITANTVRTHIRSIYEKLHVHTQTAAVSKALRAGLI
jgi:two-component system nitrate/nitrite response regulator NarL